MGSLNAALLRIDEGWVRFPNVRIQYSALGPLGAGARHIVFGANGSGKTTLARCMACVIPIVYRADVAMQGVIGQFRLFDQHNPSLFKVLRVLPQDLREYLLGLDTSEEASLNPPDCEAAGRALRDWVFQRCEIDRLLSRSSAQLSDGERQRFAIAVALAQRSPWILFDDWRAHLDETWMNEIDALLDEWVGRTGFSILELDSSPRAEVASMDLRSKIDRSAPADLVSIDQRCDAMRTLVLEYGREADGNYKLHHSGHLRRGSFSKRAQDLELSAGQFVVIAGPNGSGKTTYLRGIRARTSRWRRKRPTVVLADPTMQLTSLRLHTFLARHLGITEPTELNRANELLAIVLGVSPDFDPLELNYAARKLLALVVAVLNKGNGVLVDEPFGGMDELSSALAARAVSLAARELRKAVVITTPRALPTAQLALPPITRSLHLD